MQASNGWVISTIILVGIVIFAGNYIMLSDVMDEVNKPTDLTPLANAIVAQIEIPEIPAYDMPITRLSLKQELKANAISVCNDELDIDDLGEKYDDVTLVKEYEEDREYRNINLGIDNEDDREITIDRTYKIDIDGDKEIVEITCEVTSDDGDLEADIEY